MSTQDDRVVGIFTSRLSPADGLHIDSAAPKVPPLREALSAMTVDGQQVEMLYAEPRLGQIVAVVQESAVRSGTPETVQTAARTAGLSSPNVKVEVVPEAMRDGASVYGGGALDNCTNGFTAKRGSEVGFVTAAHCSTPRQYWSTPTTSCSSIGTAATTTQFYNSNGDMQFMKMTSNTIYNKFYASGSTPIVRGSRLDFHLGRFHCLSPRQDHWLRLWQRDLHGGAAELGRCLPEWTLQCCVRIGQCSCSWWRQRWTVVLGRSADGHPQGRCHHWLRCVHMALLHRWHRRHDLLSQTMLRNAQRIAIAVTLAAMLGACSSSDGTTPNEAGQPIVATHPGKPGSGGFGALLEGTIAVTDGCVTMLDSTGAAITPVFPESQVEPAGPPDVIKFRGKTYRDGDRLVLTGGESPGYKLPKGCPSQAWLVNPDS